MQNGQSETIIIVRIDLSVVLALFLSAPGNLPVLTPHLGLVIFANQFSSSGYGDNGLLEPNVSCRWPYELLASAFKHRFAA
jgi:hypothetical protein